MYLAIIIVFDSRQRSTFSSFLFFLFFFSSFHSFLLFFFLSGADFSSLRDLSGVIYNDVLTPRMNDSRIKKHVILQKRHF